MVIFEYDKNANAAYIYFKYLYKRGRSKKTIALNGDIILDFDKEEKLIGVDVLSANKILSRKVLTEAKAV